MPAGGERKSQELLPLSRRGVMWSQLGQCLKRPLTDTPHLYSISNSPWHSEGVAYHVSLSTLHASVSGKGGATSESTGKSKIFWFHVRIRYLPPSSFIFRFLTSSLSRIPLYSVYWSSPPLFHGTNWTCPHTRAFWDMSAPTTLPRCCSVVILRLSCCWSACAVLLGSIPVPMTFHTGWDNAVLFIQRVKSQMYKSIRARVFFSSCKKKVKMSRIKPTFLVH